MKQHKAEIISIGNEVLAGYTINTNATYISQQLMSVGLPVHWVTTIPDEQEEILRALQTASTRADVVLITGGLGPTPDDITKKTISDFFHVGMAINSEVLEDVKRFLKERDRPLTEINKQQALIPLCDAYIRNPIGTAPGLIFRREKRHFYFMPGVPSEMKYMVREFIVKDIQKALKLIPVHNRLLRTIGFPESFLLEKLNPILKNYPQVQIAFLPRQIGVDLRFRIISKRAEDIDNLNRLVQLVRKEIPEYVFADREVELEEVLGQLLNERELTVAVAESFTGGLIGDLLTNIPGSSNYLLGDLVTYSNESKRQLLNVQESTLKEFGAVSKQTAIEMVRGVQKRMQSDCSMATTGIAGPGGGTKTKPVGLAYIAVRYHDKERVREFHFGSERLVNKRRGANSAMEMLRRLLLNIE